MSTLDEIRDHDAGWSEGYVAADPNGIIAQRRTLLALLDAQSLELQAVREALQEAETLLERIWQCEIPVGQLMQVVTEWRDKRAAALAPQNRGSNLNKACDCKGETDLVPHQPWCAALKQSRGAT